MTILEDELHKEKLILKKVSNLVENTIDDLKKEVRVSEDALTEFKKVVWADSSSFDEGDIAQAKNITDIEANKTLEKEKHLKRLLRIKNKPYFASIVFRDSDGEIFNIYISLTYLKDSHLNNILYDWRSPICSLFYDYETGPCSYMAPAGEIKGELLRKRQYKIENNELLHVFDNSLNIDDDVLQDVLAEESSERMKNVVNTIQEEQNKVIRDLETDNLIVQGIAGSGKTTVALHRIAFLLYRINNLSSNNILIFSPNNIFTEYISNVLPELGEDNTLQTTFNDYLTYFITEYDDIETFTKFLARSYSKNDKDIKLISYKQSDIIIDDFNDYLNDYIANAKFIDDIEETKTHFTTLEELNELLHYKYDKLPLFERIDEISTRLSEQFYKGTKKKKATFLKLIKESINFKKDYLEIYTNFYKSKYCRISLTDLEIKEFVKKKVINYEDSLLFSYMKGVLEGFPYEGDILHVVIDEAQDYNKLQYIIISKIFRKAKFTILGDINQNINPFYKYEKLSDLEKYFSGEDRYLELNKTYRSSPEIIDYTNKILGLNHVNAIRDKSNIPVTSRRNVDNLEKLLIEDISELTSKYHRVAIITKDFIEAEKVYKYVKDKFPISIVDEDTIKFHKNLVVIPAFLAKGLEFDAVIAYNNRENSYRKNERNLLYVACTRAQHKLVIYN